MEKKKVIEAIKEANMYVSCLLESDIENRYYKEILEDLHHIQNKLTIIENYIGEVHVT
jgi:hypothetical protein